MKKPLFSILMPAYNVGKYIRESVGSLTSQDFRDWELIIVDDCSKDDTADIIRELEAADSRIKTSFRSENAGKVHVPRCDAARHATGEYVVPIDADDKVSPGYLTKLAESIAAFSPDMVIPEMWRFADGEEPYKLLPKEDVDTEKVWPGRDLVGLTLGGWRIPMAGFACRRELYLKGNPSVTKEDEETLYADELFSRILLFRCKSVAFSDARYLYRENPASITSVNMGRYGSSDSDRRLVAMMSRLCGEDSEEFRRANDQLFYGAVDALRISNRRGVPKEDVRTLERMVAATLREVDLKSLRGRVSSRYLALMSLPVPMARIGMKVIDYLMKKTGVSFARR